MIIKTWFTSWGDVHLLHPFKSRGENGLLFGCSVLQLGIMMLELGVWIRGRGQGAMCCSETYDCLSQN